MKGLKMKGKSILLGLAIMVAGQASADMIHGDWLEEGDRRITVDTSTGLKWLKLNQTLSMSVNEIQVDEQFADWRVATHSELNYYFNSFFQPSITLAPNSQTDFAGFGPIFQDFTTYAGYTSVTPLRSYGIGYNSSNQLSFYGLSYVTSQNRTRVRHALDFAGMDEDFKDQFFGTYLVSNLNVLFEPGANDNIGASSTSDVSAPLALFGATLMGLSFFRRKTNGI